MGALTTVLKDDEYHQQNVKEVAGSLYHSIKTQEGSKSKFQPLIVQSEQLFSEVKSSLEMIQEIKFINDQVKVSTTKLVQSKPNNIQEHIKSGIFQMDLNEESSEAIARKQ
ncbi:hypothetical protein SS50377_27206 [Spironucleus salmonicida]|uniref:Uncharacterized protein n=1 Tax=Spironucleus salmonicida TaxID=348837 RepID=A0A9P8LMS3_9EUKA|nr:hypothetical protein SS50377_27206 [Spironucleus salmonicida]